MPHSSKAPRMPPANWAAQYLRASASEIRPDSQTPMVTAGLMWHPEMGPST